MIELIKNFLTGLVFILLFIGFFAVLAQFKLLLGVVLGVIIFALLTLLGMATRELIRIHREEKNSVQ